MRMKRFHLAPSKEKLDGTGYYMSGKPPLRLAVEKEVVTYAKELYLQMPHFGCSRNLRDLLGLYTLVMEGQGAIVDVVSMSNM